MATRATRDTRWMAGRKRQLQGDRALLPALACILLAALLYLLFVIVRGPSVADRGFRRIHVAALNISASVPRLVAYSTR